MLAIGRGLMAKPKLLMLDEPSLGLAPIVVEQVFETVKRINSRKITILLVEQDVFQALEVALSGVCSGKRLHCHRRESRRSPE